MGKRANPLLVGSFVLGGLALAVTVIATIGSGKFFLHTQRFVVYFDGSVNGLDTGAPVKFRGVPIGTVTDVRLKLPPQQVADRRIPVLIEVVEGSPARFALPPGSGYREIPSLPTTLEQAQAKLSEVLTQLSKLDVDGIGRSVTAAADGVTRLASSPDSVHPHRAVRGLRPVTSGPGPLPVLHADADRARRAGRRRATTRLGAGT